MRTCQALAALFALTLGCDRGLLASPAVASDAAAADGTTTTKSPDTNVTDAMVVTDNEAGTDAEGYPSDLLDDAGCVKFDLRTFDLSCDSGSDCTIIAAFACPGCACPSVAINVDGLARYQRALSQLLPDPSSPGGQPATCQCPSWPTPASLCLLGTCTFPQPTGPGP